MSTINQNNKKAGSGGNSAVNTPASTPIISSVSNGSIPAQSTTPPNNAPKYGTLVPNRVFVGGISANTTEAELHQLFSNYGTVKAAKIIQDRAGVSKGYGFITFESEEEAKRLQREADNIVLRERKLNIAPAIKKQPFSRAFDAASPPAVNSGATAQYFIPAGGVPYFQGGVAYYTPPAPPQGDPATQQAPVYQPPPVYPTQSGQHQSGPYPSVMFPAQPIYMPQQFPYQAIPYEYNYYPNGNSQYMVGNQAGPQQNAPSMQPPGSPPRPPCYSQQLPYTDPIYYNMPLYGLLDGTAVYQDADMSNGNLPEDAYALVDEVPQELVINRIESLPPAPICVDHQQPDTARQSSTPVVSLLAIDQQQEIDYMSMQSGRRKKPIVQQASSYNGYNNYTQNNYHHHHGYPQIPQIPPFNNNGAALQNDTTSSYLKYTANRTVVQNGMTWTKKRRNFNGDRRNYESSSVSSFRTDSNSSASVVDENRNEEKTPQRTVVNTPPPAPYSPITQQVVKYNSRNFHSSRNRPQPPPPPPPAFVKHPLSFGRRFPPPVGNHARNSVRTVVPPDRVNFVESRVESVQVVDKFKTSGSSQMPPGVQHFVPPARRTRRSVRRNAHSNPLSEIGAGDAPLPSTDIVADTCKKLENLKL